MTEVNSQAGVLGEGDLVLLIDKKGRRHLITLDQKGAFHSHAGVLPHTEIIGHADGSLVSTTLGQKLRVLKPTLSDYILSMKRGAQVIYPKDIGPILMLADIGPGMKVFESGVGSGALSMGMLRTGAIITGYELREDFANRAIKNVTAYLGDEVLERYKVELRSSYDGIDGTDFDRVVLDLPEPWQVIPHAAVALRPGGVFLAYTPAITQVMRVTDALHQHNFTEIETTEVLNRTWHVEGQAVRPDHRMVAHTGFLTRARLQAPGQERPPVATPTPEPEPEPTELEEP